MKYQEVKISSVANFINGFPFKPENWVIDGYPIIRIQNLTDPSKPFNRTKKDVPNRYMVRNGDILVSWSATIDVFEWIREGALLNQHIFKVEFDHQKVDKAYFKLALRKTIRDLTKYAHGSTMKHVVKGDFDNHKIPLPPLDDQIRIAHLLGKVEGLIAQRKQHLQQLDELLKSVFLEMFGDPILNPREFPVRRLAEFYINPKAGTKCGPFGSALKKEELVESGVPVWNMDNIGPGGQMVPPFRMWITADKYDELAAYSVQDGDIVISRAGTVGKMCVAHTHDQPAIISTNLIRLRLGSELRPLHFVSLMHYCKGRVGRLKTGADGAFTHMNTGVLDSLEFPYPPIELQDQFGAIANKVESVKTRYQQSLAELENLYGALSQQAFKGELDLSRVPLPGIKPEEENAVVTALLPVRSEEGIAINLPDISVLLDAVQGPMRQQDILKCWLDAYREQQDEAPFSLQKFMAAAETQAGKWYLDGEYEIGVEDYEHIKTWVFEALSGGKLMQGLDDAGNRIQLKAVST